MSSEQQLSSRHPEPDPLIDEIRAIRKSIAEQFGNDVDRLCDHLQQLEKQHPERVMTPKLPKKSATG